MQGAVLRRLCRSGTSPLKRLQSAAHWLPYWASPSLSSLYAHWVRQALHSAIPAAAGGLLDEAQKLQLSGGAAEAHGQVLKWHLLCLHIRGALGMQMGMAGRRVSLETKSYLVLSKIAVGTIKSYPAAHCRAGITYWHCCTCIWLLLADRGPNSALCLLLACGPSFQHQGSVQG